jgi:C4-dicarboxylate transporter, DctQ subunit
MLVNALGPRCSRLCNVLSSLAGVIFAVILLVASIPQILRYYTLGMMTESTLDLPMWALFLAMPVGAVLLAIYYVGSVVRALRGQDPFAPLPEAVIGRGGDAA